MWKTSKIQRFQEGFLSWFETNGRKHLPWRNQRTPYGTWISEIMLQQTRVETVIGYFNRFMTRFPTIEDLARAPEEAVLKSWEGLGYYSRARNLKAAAETIVSDYHGEMPQQYSELIKLKGIGPYTAGAIASMAFGERVPAIDGNAMRVASRLFEIEQDIGDSKSFKLFWQIIVAILPEENPGAFNEALMDLGSAICTPQNPACPDCPVQTECAAFKHGTTGHFPVKKRKTKVRDVYYLAYALQDPAGEQLLERRPDQGLLAKMWQFPLVEIEKKEYLKLRETIDESQRAHFAASPAESALVSEAAPDLWLEKEEVPFAAQCTPFPIGEVIHLFSHRRWHILLYLGKTKKLALKESEVWADEEQKHLLPLSKVQQKLDQLLAGPA